MKLTIQDRIERHLKDYGYITSWEAITDYGCTRISAVIFNLRRKGLNIETRFETSKNRYGDKVSYGRYILLKQGDLFGN